MARAAAALLAAAPAATALLVAAGASPAAAGTVPGTPGTSATGTAGGPLAPAPAAIATGVAWRQGAGAYLAIAEPANRRLEHDLDQGVDGQDRGNLAAARADLRDAAATERRFDRKLLRLRFGPQTKVVARILVTANQSRARLTDDAARSTSLAELRRFERRLDAANTPVEDAAQVIRSQLGLPPPASG